MWKLGWMAFLLYVPFAQAVTPVPSVGFDCEFDSFDDKLGKIECEAEGRYFLPPAPAPENENEGPAELEVRCENAREVFFTLDDEHARRKSLERGVLIVGEEHHDVAKLLLEFENGSTEIDAELKINGFELDGACRIRFPTR